MNTYALPMLRDKLANAAKLNLPKFSGQNKVFEVIIQFSYGIDTETTSWLKGQEVHQHIKVAFWHPNNAMLVAYNFDTHVEDMSDDFIISANHSSTWEYDGLNFFHKIAKRPEAWKILQEKVITATASVEGIKFIYSQN